MKKTIKFFSLFLVLVFLVVGCGNKEEKQQYLKNVDYSQFASMVERKESFILEVVQTGCSNCTAFTPKFEAVLEEYEIVSYSLNLSEISSEDNKKFLKEYSVDGTPTVMFFENGEETSTLKRLTGNQDKEKIISKLKANGYIKE